jgi:hypothetical protein
MAEVTRYKGFSPGRGAGDPRRATAMRVASRIGLLLIAALGYATQASADPAELDGWCAQVTQPPALLCAVILNTRGRASCLLLATS